MPPGAFHAGSRTAGWLVGLSCLAGCASAGTSPPPGDTAPISLGFPDDPDRTDSRWPYRPVRMRVHPLTRLVTVEQSGETMIEARIEFLDGEGHVTKCHGQLRLDLYEAHDEIWAASHEQWNVDLRDAETNRTHFDDVTLTYVVKLRTTTGELPEQPVIRAFFFSSTGVKLEDRLRLRTE